ncbi:DUF2177 family protein [Nitratireductor aquimarinus]|uniref:DUF2177 family protein n=1 Tax=Nitratireductor TaxID=245876 RepID=UPI001A8CAB42|nr:MULTISPECIES: DUF2177 family protein [Nitratireductor]MBN8245546.1 DUF2177 family protein [Nitratireductor aquimarinus]MBY6133928.1 DUF2177 family protein [Nitratireductor aquimarinus]MCA1304941.1 DUF2177 family protein [Nitratireductor aquimarinus]MCV0378042.1 DUF2177 family protein [Nitratireductor sp.]
MSYLVAYVATALVFFGLDYIWLSRVATGFYRERMGHLLLDQPNLVAAGLFYCVYVAGIVYFAVAPSLNNGSAASALFAGAVLGLIAYGTYDMTNLATVKNWSIAVTFVDIAWGTVLTGVSAWAGYLATARIIGSAG